MGLPGAPGLSEVPMGCSLEEFQSLVLRQQAGLLSSSGPGSQGERGGGTDYEWILSMKGVVFTPSAREPRGSRVNLRQPLGGAEGSLKNPENAAWWTSPLSSNLSSSSFIAYGPPMCNFLGKKERGSTPKNS